MVVSQDQLSIDENVSGENQRSNATIDKLNRATPGEESSHESKQNQEPKPTEQVWHPVREVVLRLAREQRQRDEDAQGQHQRQHHAIGFIERGHHTDGVGFQQCKPREEEQVGRVALALPEGDEHETESTEDGDHQEPEVALDPLAVAVAEERDGAHQGGKEKLHGSDTHRHLLAFPSPI